MGWDDERQVDIRRRDAEDNERERRARATKRHRGLTAEEWNSLYNHIAAAIEVIRGAGAECELEHNDSGDHWIGHWLTEAEYEVAGELDP